jgi:hypothetical protein
MTATATGPPGNGERRPPPQRTGAATSQITPDLTSGQTIRQRRPLDSPSTPRVAELWRLLRDCPPEAVRWAALGYAACAAEAAEAKARALGEAGDDVREGGLPILLEPTYRDLNREVMRRRGDHMPCSDQCGTCTRCRLSLRYWGHDPAAVTS